MVKWYQDYKTKIKKFDANGPEVWNNLMNQYRELCKTETISYSRMNGITFVMIPDEFLYTRGLNKCINWKKLKSKHKG